MTSAEWSLTTTTQLTRIAWLSERSPDKVFGNLMHHYNEASLCYHELNGKKAVVGADGISKADYNQQLESNLQELVTRMKQMSYRPGAACEVMIPKPGKTRQRRPLNIANFEDKIMQKMTNKILESIYEPHFLDCSYGFRPGQGCHDAIR